MRVLLPSAATLLLLASSASAQRQLADIAPGNDGSWPSQFTPFGDVALFAASSPAEGRELWRTDGSAAGTWPLPLRPGPQSGVTYVGIAVLGDLALFLGDDGSRSGLFATDGTRTGARFLDPLLLGGQPPNNVSPMVVFRERAYFSIANTNGSAVYRTDGTAAGTFALRAWAGGTGGVNVVATKSHVCFTANLARELWSYDGTTMQRLTSWPASTHGTLLPVGERLFFVEHGASLTTPLWVTDGTAAGTQRVAGFPTAYVVSLADLDGVAIALTSPVDGSVDLWRTDGTAAGTTRLANVLPSPNATQPSYSAGGLVGADGIVYLRLGLQPPYGRLWRTDGTAAGTFEFHARGYLLRINSGLYPLGNAIAFSSLYGTGGYEPWVTDGTQAGTRMLADIVPGAGDSLPNFFAALPGLATGPALMFAATSTGNGMEPWIAPLGAAGAAMLAPVQPGCAAAGPVPALARAGGVPRAGNLGFGLRAETRRPGVPIALLLAGGPGTRVAGCAALLPAVVVLPGITDAAGDARFAVPVPGDPSLVGARLFVQPAVPVAGGRVLGIADLGPPTALVVGS